MKFPFCILIVDKIDFVRAQFSWAPWVLSYQEFQIIMKQTIFIIMCKVQKSQIKSSLIELPGNINASFKSDNY
jgi:hypothetical protein